MRDWSIVTKIVVSACGIVSVLVLLGGFALIQDEIQLVNLFLSEHVFRINRAIDEREQQERALLRKNVEFNTEILSEAGAIYLLNWDVEHLKNFLLRPYMNYPEILAIEVLDGEGDPFAAAWKNSEITIGEKLPADLVLDARLSYSLDSVYENERVGSFQVYYTDEILAAQIHGIKQQAASESEDFHADSHVRLNKIFIHQGIGVAFILLVQILCLIVLLRVLIFHPLSAVSEIAHKLANFDLTVNLSVRKNDEIGRLLKAINAMVQAFREAIMHVQHSGDLVSSSSSELAAAAKQQEVVVATQTNSLVKIGLLLQEISDATAELTQTMQNVACMSQEAAGFANSGWMNLRDMEEAIDNMSHSSESISGKLGAISGKADAISTVVSTINNVSEQTNLLSLNAAIEAEKAGEYGRGFSVVAREIRRLADQTAVSALDIDYMVKGMRAAVAAGVMEMDKFIADVRQSVENVGSISAQFTQIIEKVQEFSPSLETVNSSMEVQSNDARQLNTAMENLNEESRQTTESFRESFLAIELLNETARDLQNEVSRFKL